MNHEGSTVASRGNGSNNGGGGTLKRVAFKDVPEEEEENDDARYVTCSDQCVSVKKFAWEIVEFYL